MRKLSLFTLVLFVVGCASSDLGTAYDAYERQDYQAAYDAAREMADNPTGSHRTEAAYMAGISAYHLRKRDEAVRYLNDAARSSDREIAGNAAATLGLIHSEADQYDRAAQALLTAAEHLEGENQAKAYFYAAVAYRKLDRREEAMKYFALAENGAQSDVLRQRIAQERANTGWTIQIGAFNDLKSAQAEANRLSAQVTKLGQPAPQVVPAQRGNQTLYLVQIGSFVSYNTALETRDRLGIGGAMVVPKGAYQ